MHFIEHVCILYWTYGSTSEMNLVGGGQYNRGAAYFRMAHRFMNQFIKDDHESSGPLEGKIGELVGAPTLDTINEWRDLAGDVVYCDCINFNNGSADDDEYCD